jgi:hypothetical protein
MQATIMGKETNILQEILSRNNNNAPGPLQRLLAFLGGRGQAKFMKEPNALRIGILGASNVATYALIWPARRLSNVVVAAVAAREAGRAAAFAKSHGCAVCCFKFAWHQAYRH